MAGGGRLRRPEREAQPGDEHERRDRRGCLALQPTWCGTRTAYSVANEEGEFLIARFTPEGYVEADRTHLLKPTHTHRLARSRPGTRSRRRRSQSDHLVVWSHPAFANRHVVQRNDEEIIRVSLDEGDY